MTSIKFDFVNLRVQSLRQVHFKLHSVTVVRTEIFCSRNDERRLELGKSDAFVQDFFHPTSSICSDDGRAVNQRIMIGVDIDRFQRRRISESKVPSRVWIRRFIFGEPASLAVSVDRFSRTVPGQLGGSLDLSATFLLVPRIDLFPGCMENGIGTLKL